MTLAVTAVEAFAKEIDEPLTKRFQQTLVLTTSGANTDVTYDFGLYVAGSLGTFWTAVGADASFGQTALGLFNTIATQYKTYLGVYSPYLYVRSKQVGGETLGFTSAAISTGTSVSATVTGLAVGDVVQSVTQATANSNNLVPVAYGAVTANTLALSYATTSGTGGTVRVVVYRPSGTLVASTGQYTETNSNGASNITFASGDAPTSAIWYFTWDLNNGTHGTKYPTP